MNTQQPAFVITIDTEGDNLWSRPREITTHNSRYLPRFQELCEAYQLPPTYLVNYEMAQCPVFQEFGRDVLRREAGEIGMHLHAWNSPPLVPLTPDDFHYQPYLMEYLPEVMRDKIHALTDLLEDAFGCSMLSHRAGRWGLNATYVQALANRGYVVDCSVTPGVSWKRMRGAPDGAGGSDYRFAPATPYHIDPSDVLRPGSGPLLEVPMTTRRSKRTFGQSAAHSVASWSRFRLAKRAAERYFPQTRWLRPDGRNGLQLLELLHECVDSGVHHVEFMLHSSEFMPGGSPRFRTNAQVDRLYDDLERLFECASSQCKGVTLRQFARLFADQQTAIAPAIL